MVPVLGGVCFVPVRVKTVATSQHPKVRKETVVYFEKLLEI